MKDIEREESKSHLRDRVLIDPSGIDLSKDEDRARKTLDNIQKAKSILLSLSNGKHKSYFEWHASKNGDTSFAIDCKECSIRVYYDNSDQRVRGNDVQWWDTTSGDRMTSDNVPTCAEMRMKKVLE